MKMLGPVVREIVILAMTARRDLRCWSRRCKNGVLVSVGDANRWTNKPQLDPFETQFQLQKRVLRRDIKRTYSFSPFLNLFSGVIGSFSLRLETAEGTPLSERLKR